MSDFTFMVRGTFKPSTSPTTYAQISGYPVLNQGFDPLPSLSTITIGRIPGNTYSPPLDQRNSIVSIFANELEFDDLRTNLISLRRFGGTFALVVTYSIDPATNDIFVQAITSPPAATLDDVNRSVQALAMTLGGEDEEVGGETGREDGADQTTPPPYGMDEDDVPSTEKKAS